MLTLNDGRNELWQWDTGRKLTVDADCSQVHFSNKVFGRSIDVDVVDGVAIIPDVLLQTDKDLFAWAFVGTPENGYTKISKVFKVNKRNKPADYVFTPHDQTTLGEIVQRLEELEAMQDPDAIKNAVDEYLANNPIEVEETDPTVPDWAKQPEPPKVEIPEVNIPTTLPNPNALTFTGAATGTYDGSAPLTVNIPEGGSGTGGGSTEWNVICEGKIAESVSSIVIDSTADGTLLETLNVNELLICGSVFLSGNSKLRFEHNGHWVSGTYSEASKECGAWATPFRVWQRKIHNVIVTEISIHSTNIVLYTYKDPHGYYYPIKSFEIHTVTENVTFLANSTEVNVYYR